MADTQSTTYNLKLDLMFVDEDTRALTLKNPRNDLTSQAISELDTYLKQHNTIVGDKTGATFGKIKTATKVTKQEVQYDINT